MNWNKIKQEVLERDKYICQICLKQFTNLEVHHVIPKRSKGLDSLNNLFTVCKICHKLVELKPSPKTIEDKIQKFSDGNYLDFIYCGCNCGFTRSKYNEKGRIMKFISGHQNRGKEYQYNMSSNELPKYNDAESIQCKYGFIEFTYCKCGCGKTLSKYRIRNDNPIKSEPRYYIKKHANIGRRPYNYGKRKEILFEEFIYCACGCRFTKRKYDRWGRKSKYIQGHNNRGKKGLKGGYHVTNGYRFILKTDHHLADSKGYVPEHRLKFEEYNNCCLLPCAAIHHRNGNKLDNSKENLEGMTQKQHKIIHGKKLVGLGQYIKTRTHIRNQFGIFAIKKRKSS
ncbi:MAG: HNH endonuclease [Nitrososphaeraceae archaeon]